MPEEFLHYKLYKPYGVMSQVNLKGYGNKKGLSVLYPFPAGVHPIGRLDEDSEGLLLMSSNPKFMAFVNGAKFEKEYYVQLDGNITPEAILQMENGLELTINKESVRTKPCRVIKLETEPPFQARVPAPRAGLHRPYSWISISLREGKHRQVRKMTAAVGFPTLRLVRVRIGNIHLDSLQVGEVQALPSVVPI